MRLIVPEILGLLSIAVKFCKCAWTTSRNVQTWKLILVRSNNMKAISYENAIQAIAKYVDKLAKERKLQPKKDDFTVVLPLEKHQAVIAEVGENDDGERQVSYQVTETVFLMKKMKNTVLNIFEEDK